MFLLNTVKWFTVSLTAAITGNNLINKFSPKEKIVFPRKLSRPNVYTKRLGKQALVKLDDNYFENKKCSVYKIDAPTKNKVSVIESLELDSLAKEIKDETFLNAIRGACNKGSKNIYIYQDSKHWIYEERLQRDLVLSHNSKIVSRIR
ncbi:hypothetical protein MHF_1050 [Mycoplasma haemofelis Ohio2]|uniref:Uncharacterized protein n=1 Tax=Mycoplasma haemofelis (strain Ohio2) TaxID=859194 RepID=F6FJA2_MYCHI|nr:hypothetical protein MHF_1050 [Mycoplasma haemofelis Ohio2]